MTKTQPEQDLSEAFTKEEVKTLHVGQLLGFNYEGSRNDFIITRINKKSGKVFARPTITMSKDEFERDNPGAFDE